MLTITVQGGGGAIFAMDVPPSGERRKLIEGQLRKGELVLVDGDADGVAFVDGHLVALAAAPVVEAEIDEPEADEFGPLELTRDELLRMAANAGIDVHPNTATATIRKRLGLD